MLEQLCCCRTDVKFAPMESKQTQTFAPCDIQVQMPFYTCVNSILMRVTTYVHWPHTKVYLTSQRSINQSCIIKQTFFMPKIQQMSAKNKFAMNSSNEIYLKIPIIHPNDNRTDN